MTDINHAEELRRYSRKLGNLSGDTAAVMCAAADEIERLRAEFERLSTLERNTHKLLVAEQWGASSLQSEIERLRGALYSIDRQLGHDDADDALRAEITAALEGST